MSSYGRQTQSKAQNEANAKILRALVKQSDNKVCADCKKNDPRWASWNLGCFLCIRCSGIHRSMGTHISKVKSIDLDIWTPEQMASVQQWGNRRSNLYWEAHLKAGHVPAEHKVESFIRSKYEMKRWAKEGPIPSDPSTLEENGSPAAVSAASSSANAPAAPSTSSASASKVRVPVSSAIDLLGGDIGPGLATTNISKPRNSASLLDDPPSAAAAAAAAPSSGGASRSITSPVSASKSPVVADQSKRTNTGGGGGLFDLDWHAAPTSPTGSSAPIAKGNKNDILSLYSSTSPRQTAPPSGLDAFGNLSIGGQPQVGGVSSATANPWGPPSIQQAAPPNTNRSTNMFSSQDVWGNSSTTTSAAPALSNDLWGEMTSSSNSTSNSIPKTNQASQNDAFADIWK